MVMTTKDIPTLPRDARTIFRRGEWTQQTGGLCMGYAQANLAIVPQDVAFDFLLFCQRNPKPCPLLEVLDTGDPTIHTAAAGADIRTDLPKYRVYIDGELTDEPTDITQYWRDDLVAFLLGCSHSFEDALMKAGVPMRHIEAGCSACAYNTNVPCTPAGIFQGPLVVSGRPMPPDKAVKAVQVTSRYPWVHGAPVHIGDPQAIGIKDFLKPDYGAPPLPQPGDIPVFWACGVTPQIAAEQARPPLCITHMPGCMVITDLLNSRLAVL